MLFWFHLCLGISSGLIVFIMSVTGVLLMYEKQMIPWLEQRGMPEVGRGERMRIEALLAKAKSDRGTLPASIAVPADPRARAQLSYGRIIIYQDPVAGTLMESAHEGVRPFFRSVTEWHRWLATSEENRAVGRGLTGAANLAFFLIVLSGAYLWLPRVWTAASVRAVALFRGGLRGKARDFNWHNVIGVWCLAPLVFIVAGALVISYPWASNLVFTLSGSPVPAAADRKAAPRAQRPQDRAAGETRGEAEIAGLNALWSRAAAESPGWRMLTMRLPAGEKEPVVFVIDAGYGGQPQKRTTLSLDRETGDVKTSETFEDFNRGRQVRTWLRFVHTGEYYGLTGQTIAGVASAGGAVLAFTGISLSLRRWSAWRSRKRRVEEAELVS